MWPLPVSPRMIVLAVVVLSAGAAGWLTNGWRLKAKHESELKAMYAAGLQATQRRDAQIASLREQSLEDSDRIADLSRGVRVRCYTDRPSLSPASPDPDPAGDDRAAGEDAVNATDLLRQCLRSFGEINRALRVKE